MTNIKFRFLIPAFIWFLIIIWLISLPASSIPKTPFLNIPLIDKLAHAFLFGVFVVLLNYGFYKQVHQLFKDHFYTFSFVFAVIMAISTEWIQESLARGRSAEVSDIAADVAGSILGMAFFWFWKRFYRRFLLN